MFVSSELRPTKMINHKAYNLRLFLIGIVALFRQFLHLLKNLIPE